MLFGGKNGFGGQEAHTIYRAAALYAALVHDAAAQHLIAAANTHDGGAGGVGVGDGGLQAALAQPQQVGDGALCAGEDDEIRLAKLGGRGDVAHGDTGGGLPDGEIGGV